MRCKNENEDLHFFSQFNTLPFDIPIDPYFDYNTPYIKINVNNPDCDPKIQVAIELAISIKHHHVKHVQQYVVVAAAVVVVVVLIDYL